MQKLIKLLFNPAITLMNRLSYTKRFAAFGVVSLIAISLVVFNLFVILNQTIKTLEQEIVGIELVASVSKTVQLLQQHRGLSAGILSGAKQMSSDRTTKSEELKIALDALENKLSIPLKQSDNWLSIKSASYSLLARGLTFTHDENYVAHNRLIEQLLQFEATLADEYSLVLDTQIDTFYLINTSIDLLPNALETFGQIRALVTGVLAKKSLSEYDALTISALLRERDNAIGKLKINLDKAARYNPSFMQNALSGIYLNIEKATQESIQIITFDILQKKFTLPPSAFFNIATAAINSGYQELHQILLPTTKILLEQRLNLAKETLYVSVGLAFSLFIVVTYFAFGIYFSLTHNINTLTSAAHAFATGDFSQRVQLDTQNELKQIGNSFNEMADGFVSLLTSRDSDDARLRSIFDASLDAMVQIDSEGIITGWNNQAVTTFGWTVEEVMGQKLHDIIVPAEHRQAHINGLRRFLETNVSNVMNVRFHIRALHKNGHEIPIEIYINSFKLAEKYEFIAFIHDITARVQAKEQLYLADMVYQHSIEGIFITDADNSIIAVNPAFTQITGYSEEEIKGKNPRIFKSGRHDQAFYQAMWQDICTQGHWQGEMWDKRKNGEIHAKFLSINTIFDKAGKIHRYLALFSDITAHKQYEEEIKRLSESELNKAKLVAEKANLAKSEFLSSMSHELRTPMNAVLGFAQLLEMENLTEDQLDHVREILTAGYHLLDLINEVLDLSKIEAEKLDLKLEKTDLHNMVQNCLSLVQPLIDKNKVRIIDDISLNCPFSVLADRLRFKQVLLNIISNAIKYNHTGGSVTISCAVINPQRLRISVTDTGKGLSEQQQAKLFQPFERLSAQNSGIEGTGIGLVISKKLIEAMNGRIGVESTAGEGSCFWIEIPQA